MQGWEFALSLLAFLQKITYIIERLWAICSGHSLKKNNGKQIALVALNKRVTVSDSLRSFMTNERPWANLSRHSAQKSDMSDSLVICWANPFQNERFARKNSYFSYVFEIFLLLFPFFYAQVWIAPVALCSVPLYKKRWTRFVLIVLDKRATVSESLLSLFTK